MHTNIKYSFTHGHKYNVLLGVHDDDMIMMWKHVSVELESCAFYGSTCITFLFSDGIKYAYLLHPKNFQLHNLAYRVCVCERHPAKEIMFFQVSMYTLKYSL